MTLSAGAASVSKKLYVATEIINTDQGSQFSSPEFSTCFSSHVSLEFSMDGKGCAIDNIFIERFWRNIKYEKIYLDPSDNGLDLYHKIKEYMKFYNMKRLVEIYRAAV
jgi:putative transposase